MSSAAERAAAERAAAERTADVRAAACFSICGHRALASISQTWIHIPSPGHGKRRILCTSFA